MLTTIVIDERYRDTAANSILSVLSQQGGAELVTLADFLKQAGVQFDEEAANLRWDKQTFAKNFPDPRSRRICNRVVSIGKATLAALEGSQGVLTSNLVLYSYAGVLKEFVHVWGQPGMYSPAGNLFPLNLQWRLFRSRVKEVATPKFVYGFGFASVDTHDFRQPIWKSPFDLYGWKPEDVDKNRIHPFVVDRPTGKPVFLYFLGGSADVFTLDGAKVESGLKERLIQYVDPIREMFGAFMGEALFFVEGAHLTFGAFSHYMKTALSDPGFSRVIERGVEQCDA